MYVCVHVSLFLSLSLLSAKSELEWPLLSLNPAPAASAGQVSPGLLLGPRPLSDKQHAVWSPPLGPNRVATAVNHWRRDPSKQN
eukprot:556915-Heterocapsa_arctica.AAC.1